MIKIRKNSISNKPSASEKPTVETTDDILRGLAFDNSAQANIISTVSSGKIIIANSAACKLLGYSKKELLTKNRSAIFEIKESSFKKMLKQRTAERHSRALVTVIKKNGKLLSCEITSAIFINGTGIERAVTTISDMSYSIQQQKNIDTEKEKIVADNIVLAQSKQKAIDIKNEKIVAGNIIIAQEKSDARLKENNEWIKYIGKSSYDVMWDWDINTGKVYVGDSLEEVFGYKVKNNTIHFKDFIRCLLLREKVIVKKRLLKALESTSKNWNDAYMLIRKDGSIASTISRASIVRDEKGKALRLIGAIQDISKLQELERRLIKQAAIKKEYGELFQMASKLSYDGIWDWNLLTNDFFLGDGFEELFGYAVKDINGGMADWRKHLHPDDKEAVEKGLQEAIASSATHWEQAYRFIRADGSIANIYGRASIIRNAKGKAYRMIGSVHDISKETVLEEKLEMEIKLKEKQIEEAMEDAKNTERSDIGKELHDNINQLLIASKMYLDMAKQGGMNSEMYVNRSSEYTLNAIDEIRKLTKGLTSDFIKTFGVCDAITKVTSDIMEINPLKISCDMKSFNENTVNYKFKLNLYRIVQEQLNNILKHAKAKQVIINLAQKKNSIILSISDDGVGFDTSAKRKGIGVDNIKSRATSYNGNAEFVSQPGKGCVLTATFFMSGLLFEKLN